MGTWFFVWLQYSHLKISDIDAVNERLAELLAAIRPNAVGIVDSFDFHDDILDSALGAYDGRVYERIFEAANKSPLNAEPVNESFHKYLKPFLKGQMWSDFPMRKLILQRSTSWLSVPFCKYSSLYLLSGKH